MRYKKQQFQYECKDEPVTSAKKKFEVEFFNPLLDTAISSIEERFDMLSKHTDIWGFLYNFSKISSFKKDVLLKYCADLQLALTVGTEGDIEGVFLCDELISIQYFTKIHDCNTPLEVLNLIKKNQLEDLYPNIWISLRILLTIPVTVASGERSFSKLKLIKTYLRSTIAQDTLTNLATLSIENDISQNLDFSELIKIFAEKKARKVNFY